METEANPYRTENGSDTCAQLHFDDISCTEGAGMCE